MRYKCVTNPILVTKSDFASQFMSCFSLFLILILRLVFATTTWYNLGDSGD